MHIVRRGMYVVALLSLLAIAVGVLAWQGRVLMQEKQARVLVQQACQDVEGIPVSTDWTKERLALTSQATIIDARWQPLMDAFQSIMRISTIYEKNPVFLERALGYGNGMEDFETSARILGYICEQVP